MKVNEHKRKIANLCRFCGKTTKLKSAKAKDNFKNEFATGYGIVIEEDNDFIHPPCVCLSCVRHFYRLRDSASRGEPTSSLSNTPCSWKPHTEESSCICNKKVGRPGLIKKRKRVEVASGSDTASGEEEEDEYEKASCDIYSTISENLHLIDEELARALCRDLCSRFGLVFIDPKDIFSSVKNIDRQLLLKLVEAIFSLERENLKADYCDRSYKSISDLLTVTPESWLTSQNVVLKSVVNGLSDSGTKPVKKVMAVDQMYSLVKPNFISPIMFGANLVMYSTARSKMAVNIYGKLHPGGQYKTMRSWLDGLTMEIPTMPENDILTAIDNDQVLLKRSLQFSLVECHPDLVLVSLHAWAPDTQKTSERAVSLSQQASRDLNRKDLLQKDQVILWLRSLRFLVYNQVASKCISTFQLALEFHEAFDVLWSGQCRTKPCDKLSPTSFETFCGTLQYLFLGSLQFLSDLLLRTFPKGREFHSANHHH